MRKVQAVLLAFLLLFFVSGCESTAGQSLNSADINSRPLSTEEKLKDFEYMYNVLKENYPFFEVNKRLTGYDWMKRINTYRNMVISSTDDNDFLKALDNILAELHNGHAHIMNKKFYNMCRNVYGELSSEKSMNIDMYTNYEAWVKELNKEEGKRRYIGKYSDNDAPAPSSDEFEKEHIISDNIKTKVLLDSKIAYLSISSFSGFNIKNDMKLIRPFLESVSKYPVLIIDIRGNGGGDSRYWSDNLVPMLISKPLKNTNYLVFRGGTFCEAFFKNGYKAFRKIENIDEEGLTNLPPEIKSDFKYYMKTERIIQPKEPVGFNGKIYLLVDKHVFSSSEMFAEFAKGTGFATLVGQKTGGDGIGTDPIVCTLPNSGYIFTFPGIMGLTANGTCNEEFKTEPDIGVLSPKTEFFWTDGVIKKIIEMEK